MNFIHLIIAQKCDLAHGNLARALTDSVIASNLRLISDDPFHIARASNKVDHCLCLMSHRFIEYVARLRERKVNTKAPMTLTHSAQQTTANK